MVFLRCVWRGSTRWLASAIAAFFSIVLPMGHSHAAPATDDRAIESSLAALRSADIRLGETLFRLARANVELCEKRGPLTGLVVHSLGDYDGSVREVAARYFSFRSTIGIEAVMPGSPAAAAGIRQDDSLLAIDGAPVATGDDARRQVLDQVDRAAKAGPIRLTLNHGGVERTVTLQPVSGCLAHAEVRISDDLNAATDGDTIEVDSALMNLIGDPDEFACIIAHELGHIVLNHPDRLTAAHVDRGFLKDFGRNARLIKRTEVEADRLSVVLMANAGYDPFAAARYWREHGREISGGFFTGITHMKWRDRAAMLQAAAQKVASDPERPIIPAWLSSRDQPLTSRDQPLK